MGTARHLRRAVVADGVARGNRRGGALQRLGPRRAESAGPLARRNRLTQMTGTRTYRIGQIVPSSNTTMETEIPAMLRARESIEPERFTFHSSRMRMQKVTKEQLAAMDADSGRCAAELVDARVDVLGYACLVAIMSMGKGYHRESEARLREITVNEGNPTPVITSAGALIAGLK